MAKKPGGGRDSQKGDGWMTVDAVCSRHFWLRPGERCLSGSIPKTAKIEQKIIGEQDCGKKVQCSRSTSSSYQRVVFQSKYDLFTWEIIPGLKYL